MNDRERLIELLSSAVVVETIRNSDGEPVTSYETSAVYRYRVKPLADYLIAHGVTFQKHGRWEKRGNYNRCSECNGHMPFLPEHGGALFPEQTNYCPNCGAIMDLEVSDGKT